MLNSTLYYNAKEEAENYIKEEISSSYSNWYNKNPKITIETPFYSDNEKKPSYIEYKVSCNSNNDCWYIIVNLDWSDTKIPMASFNWKSISEQLMNEKIKIIILIFLNNTQ